MYMLLHGCARQYHPLPIYPFPGTCYSLRHPPQATIYTIEYQSRGLPHAHIIICLENKPTTAADVDRLVSAQVPCPDTQPRLHSKVEKHNIHGTDTCLQLSRAPGHCLHAALSTYHTTALGPCGEFNPDLKCMANDCHICAKRFPKDTTPVTFQDERGFYMYKRRENGPTAQVKQKGVTIDVGDEWVVGYNGR